MADAEVRVLLVDDKQANLLALRALLESLPCKLIEATSGAQALEIAWAEPIDLILLDVRMPRMDGFEVAANLKADDKTRRIPIIFLTAEATETRNIFSAYSVGAIDYLIKPLEPEVVRGKVRSFVEIAQEHRRLEAAAQAEAEKNVQFAASASGERYRKLIEGINHVVVWSAIPDDGKVAFMSKQAARILGMPTSKMLGERLWKLALPGDEEEVFWRRFKDVAEKGGDTEINHTLCDNEGNYLWFHTGMSYCKEPPLSDRFVHGVSVDITALKRTAEHSRLLASVSHAVARCREIDSLLTRFAHSVVPAVSDWCLILRQNKAGQPIAAAHAHADKTDAHLVQELGEHYSGRPGAAPVQGVFETGMALMREEDAAAWLGEGMTKEAQKSLEDLAPRSAMVVPLQANGQLFGVSIFASLDQQRPLGKHSLVLAKELCDRAAIALQNVLLVKQAAEAVNDYADLLAVVSHDLRNPLFALQCAASLIARKAGNVEGGQAIETKAKTMQRVTTHMERLIGDLADFTRARVGNLSIERKWTTVADVLNDALDVAESYAESRSITLRVDADDEDEIFCDRARIVQVLLNLLGNAIKFSGTGAEVVIRAAKNAEGSCFEVEDHGPGIAADVLPRIFDPYWQANPRDPRGMGLGLSIAQSIVDAHGGRLTVTSEPGVGTTFSLVIPFSTHDDARDQAGDDSDKSLDRPHEHA